MNRPVPAQVSEAASARDVAVDVRKLISQVEGGNAFDLEWTGHAYDVQQEAETALRARLGAAADTGAGLAAEITARIDTFARSTATAGMYLRLVITDTLPELPEYSPCEVTVYDGVRSGGTDFSKVIQRSTIYGTLITSVNVTDLKAYFEGGRKRHLLVYLGTDRGQDLSSLKNMLGQLPAILAASGMDAGAIKKVIEALQAGNLPPAALRLLHMAVELGQARMAVAVATPQEAARITALEARMQAMISALPPAAMPAVVLAAFKTVAAPLPPAPMAMRFTGVPKADNDNRGISPKNADPKAQIAALRALARDKTIPPEQRRELAAALRDARAGRTVSARTQLAQARMERLLLSANAAPSVIARLAPVVVSQARTASVITALRSLARDKTIPPEQRRELAVALRDARAGKTDPVRTLQAQTRIEKLLVSGVALPSVHVRLAPALLPVLPQSSASKVMAATIRSLAADKSIPPEQRREIAMALRDARAGKTDPVRTLQAQARVERLLSSGNVAPAALSRLAPVAVTQARTAGVVTALRGMARDRTIPAAERREIAMALRDARAGKADPVRTLQAQARVERLLSSGIKAPVISLRVSSPNVAQMSQAQAKVVAKAALRQTVMQMSKELQTPAQRSQVAAVIREARSVLASPVSVPQHMANVLAQVAKVAAPEATPAIQLKTAPAPAPIVQSSLQAPSARAEVPQVVVTPVAAAAIKTSDTVVAKAAPEKSQAATSGPQYNSDGSLKACCVAAFGQAVAERSVVAAVREAAAQDAAPARVQAEVKADGGISFTDTAGKTVSSYTAVEVRTNQQGQAALDTDIARISKDIVVTGTQAQQRQWSNDTAKLLDAAEQQKGTTMAKTFNHVCGPGCSHDNTGGFKAEAIVTGDRNLGREVAVNTAPVVFEKVDPPATEMVSGTRPRRTLRPA